MFPPIPTPFDAEGDVDHGALAGNLERWNEYDLAGYVVLGSNGEAVLCSEEEKARVWETARQAIPPGKLLIAGTGAESTRRPLPSPAGRPRPARTWPWPSRPTILPA